MRTHEWIVNGVFYGAQAALGSTLLVMMVLSLQGL